MVNFARLTTADSFIFTGITGILRIYVSNLDILQEFIIFFYNESRE